MAPSLKRILLGSDRIAKLFQPWIVLHLVHLYSVPLWAFHELVLEPVLELRGCVFHPSSQGRLRLLSGTPQGTRDHEAIESSHRVWHG